MIATALSVGISKRSLLEDYYPGELGAVVAAWNELHGAARRSAERKCSTSAMTTRAT